MVIFFDKEYIKGGKVDVELFIVEEMKNFDMLEMDLIFYCFEYDEVQCLEWDVGVSLFIKEYFVEFDNVYVSMFC